MDRVGVRTSHEVTCPECEAELDGHAKPGPTRGMGTRCRRCGGSVSPDTGTHVMGRAAANTPNPAPPLGGFVLVWRNGVLRLLRRMYWVGTFVGSLILLLCGGFVPVA